VPDLLGSPHRVRMIVEDDDGGESEQQWSIEVLDNTPPFDPVLLYPTAGNCIGVLQPTLTVANATDLDGDPLVYYFEVDTDPGFHSIDLLDSDPVPEDARGFTEWRVPRPLMNEYLYYWRVWASDGIQESWGITEVFRVCLDVHPPSNPDAGDDCYKGGYFCFDEDAGPETSRPVTPGTSPGCGCAPERPSEPREAAGAGTIAMLAFVFRRRRPSPGPHGGRGRDGPWRGDARQ